MSGSVPNNVVVISNPSLFSLPSMPIKTASFSVLGEAHVLAVGVLISGATQTNPVVITTTTPHGYLNGNQVFISGIVGMTPLNGRGFTIANVTTFTFELVGEDGTGYPAYISGGVVQKIL